MDAKEELFALLDNEDDLTIDALLWRVKLGRFDGRSYYDKETECGCLYGTLAILHGVRDMASACQDAEDMADAISMKIQRFKTDLSPLEEFVFPIHGFDLVTENERAAELLSWIVEYQEKTR